MTTVTVTTINELSAVWAPLLWKASWQGGLALLLILVISLAVRKIPARTQCWLWRLAFFKLLIAGLWINPVELRWLPSVKPMASENPPAAIESITYEIPAQNDAATTSLRSLRRRPIPSPEAIPQLSRLSLLLIAWIAGVMVFLANLLRHWVQVRKMNSSAETLTDEHVLNSLVEHCQQMGVSRQPELRLSNNSRGPCLIGILRPVIVLPSVVLKPCNEDELNAALIHELAHIKRRDLFWNWLPALTEVVFFFHPLVWLAKREWRLAQEIATDELALSVSRMGLARYAKSLVELAAKCPTVTICPHLVVSVSEAYSQLSRRMIAMQTFRPVSPRRRFLVTTLLLSITLFNVVPLRLTAQKPESPVGENSSQITSGSGREPSRPTLAELIAGLRAVEQSVRCLSVEYAVESRNFFTKPGEPLPENVLIQDDAVASFGRSQVVFLATADGRYRTAISTLSTHQRFDRSQVHRIHVRTAAFDGQKTRCIEMQIAADGSVRKSGRKTDRKTWYSPHPFDFTINHIGAPISEVLTSRGGNVVDRVALEKTTAYVVETPSLTLDNGYTSKRRYWIDPARNFVVVRRQILQPQNDGKQWAIHHQIDCKEHKEIRPGVWLPMQVETINNVVSDRTSHLVAKNTLSVSVWRVNDTPNADHFRLEIDVQTGPQPAEAD